jgi:hypothetical protein
MDSKLMMVIVAFESLTCSLELSMILHAQFVGFSFVSIGGFQRG